MDNDNPRKPIEKIWEETLAEIQLQLTRSTFDTWMKGTHALYIEEGILYIGTPSPYAVEWLENRLERMILQTLARHGHPGKVKFIVDSKPVPPVTEPDKPASKPPPASKAYLEIVDFDPTSKGWISVPAYALQFWRPYLGHGPFGLWETLRSYALMGDAMPKIATLADILANGNRQPLIGRTYRGKKQKGWITVLEEERILWSNKRQNDYVFRVVDRLPLLTPAQAETLSKTRQRAHSKFLSKVEVDLREWQQLTLPTLSSVQKG